MFSWRLLAGQQHETVRRAFSIVCASAVAPFALGLHTPIASRGVSYLVILVIFATSCSVP